MRGRLQCAEAVPAASSSNPVCFATMSANRDDNFNRLIRLPVSLNSSPLSPRQTGQVPLR